MLYDLILEGSSSEELEVIARGIEKEMGFRKYESIIEKSLDSLQHFQSMDMKTFLKIATEEQISIFAKQVLENYGLPNDRFNNILLDIKNYQKFEKINRNPDIILLQNPHHTFSMKTFYKYKPTYILKSKKTGLESPPSNNIEELIEMFKNLMKE